MLLSVAVIVGCTIRGLGTDVKGVRELVEARKISKSAIDVNGYGNESVWKDAKVTRVSLSSQEGAEPKSIEIEAMYTEDMIYILSKYKDATPLKIGEPWTFDGTKWEKGSYDDTLAFLWDMGVPGFKKEGISAMDAPLVRPADVFDFTKKESRSGSLEEQADMWGWCGMPEFYGRGDDMVFALDPAAAQSETMPAIYTIQHDKHPNEKPWLLNEVELNGSLVPKYKYKEGLNLTNTPRPYKDQVEEITDYAVFKAGDQSPHVVGIRDSHWGGSKDDILVKGTHTGDTWTVEMGRKLDTGNADDVALKPGNSYTFVVIIRDDAKGYSISAPITLQL